MAFKNLNLSGWAAGNKALAEGTLSSKTQKAKTKASQEQGLMAGIGTVVGAIFGGPAGAQIGAAIGGGGTATGLTPETFQSAADWREEQNLPKWQRNMSKSDRAAIAQDPMQMASAMNALQGGDYIDAAVAASKMYGGLA